MPITLASLQFSSSTRSSPLASTGKTIQARNAHYNHDISHYYYCSLLFRCRRCRRVWIRGLTVVLLSFLCYLVLQHHVRVLQLLQQPDHHDASLFLFAWSPTPNNKALSTTVSKRNSTSQLPILIMKTMPNTTTPSNIYNFMKHTHPTNQNPSAVNHTPSWTDATTIRKIIPSNASAAAVTFTFHRWKDPTGIRIEPLWQYMQQLVRRETTTLTTNHTAVSNTTTTMKITQEEYDEYHRLHGPIPAWIDSTWTLRVAVQVYRRRSRFNVQERLHILGPFLQQALMLLRNVSQKGENHPSSSSLMSSSSPSFHYLKRAIQNGGLPIIFLADDFTGCLRNNYNYTTRNNATATITNTVEATTTTTVSVPFLTLSAAPECDHAFPIPSYSVLQWAKPTMQDWDVEFSTMDQRYPWSNKRNQAVWRGTLSGTAKWKGSVTDVPRIQLLILGKQYPKILDVALACA